MKRIGIIGGGFSGSLTAIQLIHKSDACEIILINKQETFNKGFAYNPYSDKQLLNVIAAKMSAFAEQPDHFLDWVMEQNEFKNRDRTLIANSFLSRKLYGAYLVDVWNQNYPLAAKKGIKVRLLNQFVVDINIETNSVSLFLDNGETILVDQCVIATGNQVPRNPSIKNETFYPNKNYYQNPWIREAVQHVIPNLPVLIVGNGLTMVDTVLGLKENGFNGEIYSISPKGFNILPHRHNGLKYEKLVEELSDDMSLREIYQLVSKHIKAVREYGVSAEPVIDSLRPHTQRLWKGLSDEEKRFFMSRLRHLWGVARHRIPLHTYDKIQQLRIDGKLHIQSGRIVDFVEQSNAIEVSYFDKKEGTIKSLFVSRIINCTGPETDLRKVENSFLKNCLLKGDIVQDALKLGINTNTETFQVKKSDGTYHSNLFTLGGNLKGELWESTAVNELRIQSERLAEELKVVF
jgi:uncharacterized NAD(P)/FAD-binding protein YdhS